MLLSATLLILTQASKPLEVPFRIGENAIIVDATVNQRKLSFMFDTGFSGALVIDSQINIGKASGNMKLRDFVGEFDARTVPVKSLSLGPVPIKAEALDVVQMPSDRSSFAYNAHVDGIMGFEVVRKFVTEINFSQKKFLLHPATTDITKRQPDGQRTFLLKMLPKGHGSIELEVETPQGGKMMLGLDTGNAFYATTHRDVLERLGLWPKGKQPAFMRSAFVASGEVASWTKEMQNLKIFGVPVAKSYWSIIDLPSSSADHDGTVGFGFLKNFNITVDYERRRVWLERTQDHVGNQPEGEIGITAAFEPRSGRVKVYRVAPQSPAARAGIKVGDAILRIDDKDNLDHIGYRQLEAMLIGEKGSKVSLVTSRAGAIARQEIVRDYLFNP